MAGNLPGASAALLLGSVDVLRTISAQLTHVADQLATINLSHQAANSDRKKRRRLAIDLIAYQVARGVPDGEAILRAVDETGCSHDDLRRAWPVFKRSYAAHEQYARRLVVELLTARGFTNGQIADVLDIHVKHVPRMRKALQVERHKRRVRAWNISTGSSARGG